MIKILLAEDHQLVRRAIRNVLHIESDFQVYELAEDIANSPHVKDGFQPDIIVAGLAHGLNDVEHTLKYKTGYPSIKLIVLSSLDNYSLVMESLKSGADGYLLKSTGAMELIFAIRHVIAGNKYVCSDLVFRTAFTLSPQKRSKSLPVTIKFSDRELSILQLIAEGCSSQDIAEALLISRRTVEGYRRSLVLKTRVNNTASLIKFAIINGYLS